MQHPAQFSHESLVGNSTRRRGVECAGQILALECLEEQAIQIREMDPADVLISGPDRATAEPPGESAQDRQRPSVASENEPDPQQHTAGSWHGCRVESVFPVPANLGQFVRATWSVLIAPLIAAVSVKPNRTRLHPHARRMHDVIESRRNNANRIHARRGDFLQVFRTVRAIDIASGKIHHRIRPIQVLYPFADVQSAPFRLRNSVVSLAR
jgi:hypothetical protein